MMRIYAPSAAARCLKTEKTLPIGERHLFSWLHLSDLHFGHGNTAYGWNQKTVLDLLQEDVSKALENWPEMPHPQAILVTGDIAFSGGVKSASEYNDACAYLKKLLDMLQVTPQCLYMVPGNHDVQRDVAKNLVDEVRANTKTLDDVLGSATDRAALMERFANYKAFADQFVARDLAAWTERIKVKDFGEIALIGLNTALVSNDDEDAQNLALAAMQQHAATTTKAKVRLLLTHHPFQDGWVREEATLKTMAQSLNIHLCGHVHDPRVDLVSQAGAQHHIRVIAASAHRDPNEAKAGKDSHGYNFSSLFVNANGELQLRIWPRRWYPQWTSFRVDAFGVGDRRFFDDKSLGEKLTPSGLVFEPPEKTRIAGIHWWGKPAVRWDELLYGTKSLDVFGISLGTLITENSDHVKAFLERGGEMRVVLADPRLRHRMARYDDDFETPLGDRSRKVLAALKTLHDFEASLQGKAALKVYLTRYTFKYSAYRIDGHVLFVPYRMMPGRRTADTPALVFDRQSTLVTRHLGEDLDELIASSELLTAQLAGAVFDSKYAG